MKLKLSFFLLFINIFCFAQAPKSLPTGFVYIKDFIPDIASDLKYLHKHNFIGKPINGYHKNKLILTRTATLALKNIENELNKEGLGLKVYDAFRPQKAVNHFKEWAQDINDTIMKKEFYPTIDKRNLFKLGFIASKSGHSRGSTIDLTIINLKTKEELDMGGPFDFFGDLSSHDYKKITPLQKNNRTKLKNIMFKYGFKSYDKEWWHYTLIDEPFPKTYYDFNIE